MCSLHVAPSGYPQNLSAVPTSSSSLLLTWQPPLPAERNGEIVLYTINVTIVESGEEFQLTSLVANLSLSSLRPYYTYTFAIAASTVIGEGPFSLLFTIRMPEDGTWRISMIASYSNLHATHQIFF